MQGISKMSGNVSFNHMVNSLCSNPFNGNNAINNTNGAAFTKKHGTLDENFKKVPIR